MAGQIQQLLITMASPHSVLTCHDQKRDVELVYSILSSLSLTLIILILYIKSNRFFFTRPHLFYPIFGQV